MYKSYSMELAGRTLTVDINRVAKQANGAALMHYGDTTVLSTATASQVRRQAEAHWKTDLLQLSVLHLAWLYQPFPYQGFYWPKPGANTASGYLLGVAPNSWGRKAAARQGQTRARKQT